MVDKPFNVNIYKVDVVDPDDRVSLTFKSAIDKILGMRLDARHQNLYRRWRRLESGHVDTESGCYLLDFLSFSYTGPSKGSLRTPVKPFDMEGPDGPEEFVHETAALYDPRNEIFLLEATGNSIKGKTVAKYVGGLLGHRNRFDMVPAVEKEVATRARQKGIIGKVTMRIAVPPATADDHRTGSIDVMEALANDYGAQFMEVRLWVRGGNSMNHGSVWQTLNRLIGRGEDEVKVLKIDAMDDDDTKLELIDLLQNRKNRTTRLQVDDEQRKVLYEAKQEQLLLFWRDHVREVYP